MTPLDKRTRQEIRKELEAHVDERVHELVSQGMDPDEARSQAAAEFGDASEAQHEMERMALRRKRSASTRTTIASLWGDVRYALRSLLREPGYTAVVVLAAAAGIGASTAVFSVADGVLLRPLAYAEPERIVTLWARTPQGVPNVSPSYPDYRDWQSASRTVESMAFVRGETLTHVNELDGATQINTAFVTPEFVEAIAPDVALGSLAALGDATTIEPVLVLKHSIWQSRFQGDSTVVGRVEPFTDGGYRVIAVLDPEVDYPLWADGYARLTPERIAERSLEAREFRVDHRVVGRLADGVSIAAARAELEEVSARLAIEYPASNEGWGTGIRPLRDTLFGDVRVSILVLMASVAGLLLIACGNVASLGLARALDRTRELSLRASLGAAPARIGALLWIENLIVALAGGLLGLVGAHWGVKAFLLFGVPGLPRTESISVDGRVLAFAIGTSIVAAMLSGLPAIAFGTRANMSVLRGGGSSRASERMRFGLVAGQVALTVTLMAGSALLVRSFQAIQRVDTGFDPASMTTLRLNPPSSYQGRPDLRNALYDRLLVGAASRPGITHATLVNHAPLAGTGVITPLVAEGVEPDDTPAAWLRTAGPDFFDVLGIPIIAGRGFEDADHENWSGALLISEVLATQLWGDADPIGRRLVAYRQIPADPDFGAPIEGFVAGVVGNTRRVLRAPSPTPAVYLPMSAHPWPSAYLIVRARDGVPVLDEIRDIVVDADPEIPVTGIIPYTELANISISRDRFLTSLSSVFSGLAFFLALTGTYGILAYAVRRRAKDIAIQAALGSGKARISAQVFRQATLVVGSGIVVGVAGAFAATRFLSAVLFEVSPLDPVALVGSALLVGLLAALGGWIPARRAASVDPMVVLRE